MAELPEIEIFKQKLQKVALRKRIGALRLHNAKGELVPEGAGMAEDALHGREITDIYRYGAQVFCELDRKDILALQLGGDLHVSLDRPVAPEEGATVPAGLEMELNAHWRLQMQGSQLGARVRLLDENSDVDFLTKLGPDPLLVPVAGLEGLREALARRRSALRNVLLDDAFVPGIGALWADEILFQARLRPDRTAPSLNDEERGRFLEQIPKVLERALRSQAKLPLLPRHFLTRHREDGHCPSCGGALEQLSISGKSALFCPACQV